jgi:hypothetical protein
MGGNWMQPQLSEAEIPLNLVVLAVISCKIYYLPLMSNALFFLELKNAM